MSSWSMSSVVTKKASLLCRYLRADNLFKSGTFVGRTNENFSPTLV